jgi:type II secretory ATPase GspE/PulE/Tfp pilus assembly ATPase PilB-like protein
VVNLAEMKLDDDLISSVPRNVAKKYRIIPVFRHGNHLAVALSDPSDLNTIDSLHHILKAEIDVKVASEEEIEAALTRYYGAGDPVARFDAMVETARAMSVELAADLFDERGSSWSSQRERYLREELIEYRHQGRR